MESIQGTKAYMVQINEVDRHASEDPAMIVLETQGTQFKQSHPSVYMPKHQYTKYRMKDGRNKTGLNIIKEKPMLNSQFAIMHLFGRQIGRPQQEAAGTTSGEVITGKTEA